MSILNRRDSKVEYSGNRYPHISEKVTILTLRNRTLPEKKKISKKEILSECPIHPQVKI